MLDPDVRRVLDGSPIAHLATVLPDGSPHTTPVCRCPGRSDRLLHRSRYAQSTQPAPPRMALSIAPAENPFEPVVIRGRVVEWIDEDASWEIIDQMARKYTGAPYPQAQERVAAIIEAERQTVAPWLS